MAECAARIIGQNGLSGRIRLVGKRSTALKVGAEDAGGDIPRRCNLLVTEVFDTELIGEGALATFKHAHQHLLEVRREEGTGHLGELTIWEDGSDHL